MPDSRYTITVVITEDVEGILTPMAQAATIVAELSEDMPWQPGLEEAAELIAHATAVLMLHRENKRSGGPDSDDTHS